jgi:hypothetical protein
MKKSLKTDFSQTFSPKMVLHVGVSEDVDCATYAQFGKISEHRRAAFRSSKISDNVNIDFSQYLKVSTLL